MDGGVVARRLTRHDLDDVTADDILNGFRNEGGLGARCCRSEIEGFARVETKSERVAAWVEILDFDLLYLLEGVGREGPPADLTTWLADSNANTEELGVDMHGEIIQRHEDRVVG